MRSRRRQRKYEVRQVTVSDDDYGQPIRSYARQQMIAGYFITGSNSKGELAEAIQGTQCSVLETRYIPDFVWTLEHRLQDVETKVEYRITGIEDVNTRHDTFKIELEEVVQ